MPTSQQPDTAKLDTYYQHTLDNSGKNEFYNFLYKYIETIKKDEQLSKTVNNFWIKQLTEDFRAIDNETFKKALLPYLAEHGLSDKQADSLTNFQQFEVMWRTLAANRLWSTKPYACWFMLDRHFYGKISNNLDVSQPIAPSNSAFTQADYETALRVFHADFISWLQTYSGQTTEETKYIGNARIYYENYMTYISLPNEKEPFKLRNLNIKPNSGYDYFLNYMFEPKNESQLITVKDIHALNMKCEHYHNVGEVLRHCGFSIALKKVFMPDRCDADGFKYFKERPITQEQVDAVKEKLHKT
jgi:hypothetical protein